MKVQVRILDKLQGGDRWGSRLYRFLLLAKHHLDAVWATNKSLEQPDNNAEMDVCEMCARREYSSSSDEDVCRRDTKRRFWADAGIFEHKRRCWGNHQFCGKADIPKDTVTAKSTGDVFEKIYSVRRVRVRDLNEPWITESASNSDTDSS
ncbi:hypothetical protein TWF506_000415 [Arthrobotrys conoides]|uniref:Uncharacterized protein n=1 Tax=Arthrobotrys conoides TaxID=74498 RepID=A0AAN8NVT1_9PEZI